MNLLVFLSDRCSMKCSYCFLSLNEGPATVLPAKDAAAACRAHLQRFGRKARVTLLGGEPLLHADAALAALRAVRELSSTAPVQLVTNGLLCCPERLDPFFALGADVCVSADGAAAAHDARRPDLAGRPTHERVMAALEGVASKVSVNMVLGEKSAPALLAGLETLRARGVRRVSFHPDVLERWSPEGLRALGAAVAAVQRYLRAAGGTLSLTHLESYARPQAGAHGYDDVVLGADGRYYPCDGLFTRPYAELSAWTCGDLSAGLDEAKRAAFQKEAEDFIHRRAKGPHYGCPREPYFYARARGEDPAPYADAFLAADAVFAPALREAAHA